MKKSKFSRFRSAFGIVMLLIPGYVFGQVRPGVVSDPVSILSSSPEASALGKFSEIPVSEYTGIPNIDIPIWQINQGDINMPINLSYHAGGIKVDDIAPWVGAGWALISGGEVIRVTRGIPDGFNSQDAVKRYVNNQMTNQEKQTFINSVYRGNNDSEPDLYIVRAGDLNFSFFEDQQGNFQLMSNNPNVRIQRDINNIDWVITNGKGMKYKFGAREYSEADSRFRKSGASEIDGGYFFDANTWFLTEVEDTKNNQIFFEYATNTISYLTRGTEKVKVPLNPGVDCQMYSEFSYTYNTISSKRIKAIIFKNGRINFYEGSARLDCNGDKSIDRIEVLNGLGTLIKKVKFFTSYFENNSIGTSGLNYFNVTDHKRLRLDSLREESNSAVNAPYKFNYNYSIGLPYRNSNAQDHWGYFNGQNNATSVSYYDGSSPVKQGANKDIDPSSTLELSLAAITYPTGGSTLFEFENNRFMLKNDGPAASEYVSIQDEIRLTGNNNSSDTEFHFEKQFTITEEDLQGSSATARFRLYREGFDPNTSATIACYLTKPNGSTVGLQVGIFNTYELTVGTYVMKVDLTTEYAGNPYVYFDCGLIYSKYIKNNIPDPSGAVELVGPGLRIKRITKKPLSGPDLIEEFSYNDPVSGKTSGLLGNIPDYVFSQVVKRVKEFGGSSQLGEFYECNYNVYSSTSNRSLINSKGSYVGYSVVTRKSIGDQGNGKVVSRFTNFSEFNDLNANTGFPYPPNSSQDWKRGLILNKIIYDVSGTVKRRESYKYNKIENSTINNYGLKVVANTLMDFNGADETQIYNGLSAVRYDIGTDKYDLVADTIIDMDNGVPLIKTNQYYYSNNGFNLNQIETSSSEGSKIVKYYYPKDYLNYVTSSPVLSSLLEYNILELPIEEFFLNKRDGVEKGIGGIANEYGYDMIDQHKVFSLRKIYKANVNQIGLTDRYDFVHLPAWYEERVAYNFNDSFGKPRSVLINKNVNSVYLYSYNGLYPVAEIKNVDFTTVESLLGAQAIEAFSNRIAPEKADVDAFLAPLKSSTLLKDAQITSYTYKPLVGMTSQTDAKSMTTYYEYDAFQRLKAVKDQNGNILKQTDYHYKN
jgi:YD repeat-containing protein